MAFVTQARQHLIKTKRNAYNLGHNAAIQQSIINFH